VPTFVLHVVGHRHDVGVRDDRKVLSTEDGCTKSRASSPALLGYAPASPGLNLTERSRSAYGPFTLLADYFPVSSGSD
jgi:hypothetical protein